jgi:hypothetical protein
MMEMMEVTEGMEVTLNWNGKLAALSGPFWLIVNV